MKYENFTQMPVWKKAFDLMLKIYQITKSFPSDERFCLISDMLKVLTQSSTISLRDLVASTLKRKVTSIGFPPAGVAVSNFPEGVDMNCGVRFYIGKT